MASQPTLTEKLATCATILGLPVAILGLVLAYLQLRPPAPHPGPRPPLQQTLPIDNPNYFSGWTTIFEDQQVLQGRGGTMSLYNQEVAAGFQVFVHIPRERVIKSEWMKDGDGQNYLAVTVSAP